MIFHASISAAQPEHVASVIAEIWKGEAFRFPPWPGAYVAMAGDARSSTVEVYPLGHTIAPGEGREQGQPRIDPAPYPYTPFHLAIATERSPEEIIALGQREGWRAVRCSRGGLFDVIEFWIENRVLVEVLTSEMQQDYLAKVNTSLWRWTQQVPAANAA